MIEVSDKEIEAVQDRTGLSRELAAEVAGNEKQVYGEVRTNDGLEAKAWVPYVGPEGGEGWQSTENGDVVYQDEAPGEAVGEELLDASPDELLDAVEEVFDAESREGLEDMGLGADEMRLAVQELASADDLADLGEAVDGDDERETGPDPNWRKGDDPRDWGRPPDDELDEYIEAVQESEWWSEGRESFERAFFGDENTFEDYTDDDGEWDERRVEEVHDPAVEAMLNEDAESDEPVGVLLMGPPGAGKGWWEDNYADEFDREFTRVNSDDAKEHIPGYEGSNAAEVHEESSHIAKSRVFPEAVERSQNVMFDAVSSSSTDEVADAMRENGYDVRAVFVDVPSAKSAHNVVERYDSEGRFTPLDYTVKSRDESFSTFAGAASGLDPEKVSYYDNDVEWGEPPRGLVEGEELFKALEEALNSPGDVDPHDGKTGTAAGGRERRGDTGVPRRLRGLARGGGLRGPEGLTAKAWVPYAGPRGGSGWRNTDTGDIIYQDEAPGAVAGAGELSGLSDEELVNVLDAGSDMTPGDLREAVEAVSSREEFEELVAGELGLEGETAAGSEASDAPTTSAADLEVGDRVKIDGLNARVTTKKDMGGGFYIAGETDNGDVVTARVGPSEAFEEAAPEGDTGMQAETVRVEHDGREVGAMVLQDGGDGVSYVTADGEIGYAEKTDVETADVDFEPNGDPPALPGTSDEELVDFFDDHPFASWATDNEREDYVSVSAPQRFYPFLVQEYDELDFMYGKDGRAGDVVLEVTPSGSAGGSSGWESASYEQIERAIRGSDLIGDDVADVVVDLSSDGDADSIREQAERYLSPGKLDDVRGIASKGPDGASLGASVGDRVRIDGADEVVAGFDRDGCGYGETEVETEAGRKYCVQAGDVETTDDGPNGPAGPTKTVDDYEVSDDGFDRELAEAVVAGEMLGTDPIYRNMGKVDDPELVADALELELRGKDRKTARERLESKLETLGGDPDEVRARLRAGGGGPSGGGGSSGTGEGIKYPEATAAELRDANMLAYDRGEIDFNQFKRVQQGDSVASLKQRIGQAGARSAIEGVLAAAGDTAYPGVYDSAEEELNAGGDGASHLLGTIGYRGARENYDLSAIARLHDEAATEELERVAADEGTPRGKLAAGLLHYRDDSGTDWRDATGYTPDAEPGAAPVASAGEVEQAAAEGFDRMDPAVGALTMANIESFARESLSGDTIGVWRGNEQALRVDKEDSWGQPSTTKHEICHAMHYALGVRGSSSKDNRHYGPRRWYFSSVDNGGTEKSERMQAELQEYMDDYKRRAVDFERRGDREVSELECRKYQRTNSNEVMAVTFAHWQDMRGKLEKTAPEMADFWDRHAGHGVETEELELPSRDDLEGSGYSQVDFGLSPSADRANVELSDGSSITNALFLGANQGGLRFSHGPDERVLEWSEVESVAKRSPA